MKKNILQMCAPLYLCFIIRHTVWELYEYINMLAFMRTKHVAEDYNLPRGIVSVSSSFLVVVILLFFLFGKNPWRKLRIG